MEQMSVNLRMKCSPTDKRMLGELSRATGDNESEVLRKLIRIANDRVISAAVNSLIHDKKIKGGVFDLNSVFDGSDTEDITRSLLHLSRYYAAGGARDNFMEEVLAVVFAEDPAKLKRAETAFDIYMQGWYFEGQRENVTEQRDEQTQEMLKAFTTIAAEKQASAAEAEAHLEKVKALLDEVEA